VLVGLDGSAESRSALALVVELFGARLRSVTVAGVIDYASGPASAAHHERIAVAAELADAVAQISATSTASANSVLLAGPIAESLRWCAEEQRCDLIVVGTRGLGGSESGVGRVASRLASAQGVPVLVVGTPAGGAGGGGGAADIRSNLVTRRHTGGDARPCS
jgi:nucleotide-binding universal stress UspA family protein